MTERSGELSSWVGRERVMSDMLTPDRLVRLGATLDRDDPEPVPGDPLPPCWHWMFFQDTTPMAKVGPDGHPVRGDFMPPIDKPRRMWAGSRIEFIDPPRVGEAMRRLTRIDSVTEKAGKSGSLVFVGLVHEISTNRGLAIREEMDLVFRDMPTTGAVAPAPPPAPSGAVWLRAIHPDPVLLFRYSALTFNGHRIHYDRPYVTEVEGYPGLIVHGPLIATLLLDLLHRNLPTAKVARFSFRAVRPVFDIHRFTVCGKHGTGGSVALWTRDQEGMLTMEASAELG